MVDPTEDQLDNADQHAAILTAKLTTAVLSFPSVGSVHQQPADNHHKQPTQLTKLKEGVCGYHQMNGDRALNFKCAPQGPDSYTSDMHMMRRRPQKFLVDIGACVSITLVSNTQQLFTDIKTFLTLMAANGTSITKYGTAIRTIQLNGCACERGFTSAQTSVPLLGGDFLAHHGLIVVLKHGRLADPEAIMAVQPQRNPVQQPVNTSLVNNTPYQHAVDRFCDVFFPQLRQQRGAVPKNGVYHHIATSDPVVFSRPLHLGPQKLHHATTSFQEMEAMGVCTKAQVQGSPATHDTEDRRHLEICNSFKKYRQ